MSDKKELKKIINTLKVNNFITINEAAKISTIKDSEMMNEEVMKIVNKAIERGEIWTKSVNIVNPLPEVVLEDTDDEVMVKVIYSIPNKEKEKK